MGSACTSINSKQVRVPGSTTNKPISKEVQPDKASIEESLQKQNQIGKYFIQSNDNNQDAQKRSESLKMIWKKMLALAQSNNQQFQSYKLQQQNMVLQNRSELFISKEKEWQLLYLKNKHQQQFNVLLKAGPPCNFRWLSWKIKIFKPEIYQPLLYSQLVKKKSSQEHQISKDISRTFPDHVFFKASENNESQGQDKLFSVLKAISNYFPQLGYTQGMNFWVGFLLLVNGGNEEEAFWFFVTLCWDPNFMLIGFFEEEFPFLNFLLFVFKKKFQQVLPKLYKHFQEKEIQDGMWIWKWILTQFIYSFPFEIVIKFWDYIFSTDIFGNLTLGLAILQHYEKLIMAYDFSEISQFFRDLKERTQLIQDKESEFYLNLDQIFKSCKNYTFSRDYLSSCAHQYKQMNKEQINIYINYYSTYLKYHKISTEQYQNQIKLKKYSSLDNNQESQDVAEEQLCSSLQNECNDQLISNSNNNIGQITNMKKSTQNDDLTTNEQLKKSNIQNVSNTNQDINIDKQVMYDNNQIQTTAV